jgi:lipoprotein signal peptidase
MEKTVVVKQGRQPWPWYAAAAVLFLADRALKDAVLAGGHRRLSAWVEFTLFRNEGIAFSLPLNDVVFWVLAVPVFLGLIALFLAAMLRGPRFRAAALAFVVLGAASNLDDRLLYGATIDYLLFFGRSAVNLADGMILGGVLALLFKSRGA